MPRVRKGAARTQARKKILREARGYYGSRSTHKYIAKDAVARGRVVVAGIGGYSVQTAIHTFLEPFTDDEVLALESTMIRLGAGHTLPGFTPASSPARWFATHPMLIRTGTGPSSPAGR